MKYVNSHIDHGRMLCEGVNPRSDYVHNLANCATMCTKHYCTSYKYSIRFVSVIPMLIINVFSGILLAQEIYSPGICFYVLFLLNVTPIAF